MVKIVHYTSTFSYRSLACVKHNLEVGNINYKFFFTITLNKCMIRQD